MLSQFGRKINICFLYTTRDLVYKICAWVMSLGLAGNQGLLGPSCPVLIEPRQAGACQLPAFSKGLLPAAGQGL